MIESLRHVEIKTHTTSLLNNKSYRRECWRISDELSGAISQIQKTVQKSIKPLSIKEDLKDENGNPTGESVYLTQPKSYLIIGTLKEFITQNGVNEEKYSSFELFRRSINFPEIITFDELYACAKNIVDNEICGVEVNKS